MPVRRILSIGLLVGLFWSPTALAQEPPPTVELLSWMPDTAYVALGLPPVRELEGQVVELAERLMPEGTDVRALFAGQLVPLAAYTVQPQAKTLSRILRAAGLSPERPAACFADFSPLRDALLEAIATGTPNLAPLDFHPTRAVLVLPVLEQAVVESLLGQHWPLLDDTPLQSRELQGMTLQVSERWGYGFVDSWLLIFNDVSFLEEVLRARATPRPPRYGGPECPAEHPAELVLLTRLDKVQDLTPDAAGYAAALRVEAASQALANDLLQHPRGAFDNADPSVTTLQLGPAGAFLSARLDLSRHQRFAELYGTPPLADFATGLPAGNALMLVGLNAAYRERLAERAFSQLPTPPELMPYLTQLDRCLSVLETAGLGMSFAEPPMLDAQMMATDSEVLRQVAQELAPLVPLAPSQSDCELFRWEWPLPLYLAIQGNRVGVSTSEVGARNRAALPPPGAANPVDALLPPLGLRPGVIHLLAVPGDQVAAGAHLLQQALGTPWPAWLDALLQPGLLRELRAGKVVERDWQRLFLSLYLN